jgi:eukaryotic-like serine/threonine-protein kinase
VGDTVVIGSCNGLVHGVDKSTGALRWRYDATRDGGSPEFHGAPLVGGDLVILASDDRRPDGVGHVYAIEAASGAVRWKTPIGRGSMADVLLQDGRLYAVTLDDVLVALDLASGKEEWSFQAGPPLDPTFLNLQNAPAVVADRVYLGGADGVLYALSSASGAVLWKSAIGSRILTPVVTVSDGLCLGTRDGRLLLAETSDGSVRVEIQTGQIPFGPLAVAGESVLVYGAEGDSGVLNAFAASLAARRWSRRAPRGWSSMRPHLWRGAVLAGDEGGELDALAVEDGAVLWARQLDGVIRAIGSEGDLLFVGTLKGAVHAIRPPGAAHEDGARRAGH